METTGRVSTTCEIIEIAALKVIDNQVVDTFQSLVKPKHPIPLEVQTLTEINDKMVASAPALTDILPKFLDFIDNQLLLGYNIASFDLHVLNRHCIQCNYPALTNQYIDLLHLARKSFPNISNYKLVTVAHTCDVSSNNAHRALADSYMVHECFSHIKKQFPSVKVNPKLFSPSSITKKEPQYNSTTQPLKELQEKECLAPTKFLSKGKIQTLDKKSVCLTGKFIHCDRDEVKNIIESNGGRCVSSVSGKTDYVIVGSYGSPDWSCGNYGSKIKKALELQEKGKSVLIYDEQVLFNFLDEWNTEKQTSHPPKKPYIVHIELLLTELIEHYELPENSLYLDSNLSKKGESSGHETSKSICIFEPEYPPQKKVKETLGRNFVVMNLKPTSDERVELLIRTLQFDSISLPKSATLKNVKSDQTFFHVLFDSNSDDLLEYIRDNIVFALANYKSSHSFGCCSRFVQCSDAKRCVHDNKLYSKGCKYRIHLEAGRIFYGKNANVE